ncbi:MAG: exodeoxyribonuclease VII large subunit [Acidimicrobiales bacterium]|nr:MAG: exodeoxyribonuclease VII large subunit [Acidimicrobiales bacterium]
MEMLPFEPLDTVRRVSLVRLSAEIAHRAASIGVVAVEGEVARPRTTGTGRVYLTLRDRASQVTVTCPPGRARRCRTVHGERVCVTGSLSWMNDRGELLLVAAEVVPVGAGAIAAAQADVRRRLVADGLVGRRARPIPRLPAVVGVVCGADAAVRADIESVVAVRFPGYPVDFVEVHVSGPGAAEAVIGALAGLDARPEVEVVILARGGGDPASLMTFSDEELCRAIAASTTPVVSAIGHEGDRPLCDEVADLRCGTPSLAAAAVVPDQLELLSQLDRSLAAVGAGARELLGGAVTRLGRIDPAGAARASLAVGAARLEKVKVGLAPTVLRWRLADADRRLAALDWKGPLLRRVGGAGDDLASRRRETEALGPARVLARGYAVVRTADGTVVRDPAQVAEGDDLQVAVARGNLRATVTQAAR